jgi:hypothetical protein
MSGFHCRARSQLYRLRSCAVSPQGYANDRAIRGRRFAKGTAAPPNGLDGKRNDAATQLDPLDRDGHSPVVRPVDVRSDVSFPVLVRRTLEDIESQNNCFGQRACRIVPHVDGGGPSCAAALTE